MHFFHVYLSKLMLVDVRIYISKLKFSPFEK
jgi:hypothetical protein